MSIERVREYLKQFQADQNILEFPVSSATVELAAQAANCEPARIAKTLSFYGQNGCLLVVAAGDAKIDNSKFKHTFGCKAKMLYDRTCHRRSLSFWRTGGSLCISGYFPAAFPYRISCLRQQQQRH